MPTTQTEGSRVRAYRVYDSAGTVMVPPTLSRAKDFKRQGYPVEIWEVESGEERRLKRLDGGQGPHCLSGGAGERVGSLEWTDDGEDIEVVEE